MTVRGVGLTLGVTTAVTVGVLAGVVEIVLATRPRIEAWKQRIGTGMYPRDLRWPGMPR